MRYALRMAARPTPFGAFAGVGLLDVGGEQTRVSVTGHERVVRVGAGAAQGIIRTLEDSRFLELEVMLNPSAHRRADRLESLVNAQQERSAAHDVLSVALTPAVMRLAEAAEGPIRVSALIDVLSHGSDSEDVRVKSTAFVKTLLERGFLISQARASVCDEGPVERARMMGADGLLDRIPSALTLPGGCGHDRSIDELMEVLEGFSDSDTQELLQVDTRLELTGAISQRMADDASDAAEILAVMSPVAAWSPELNEYAQRFQERYGYREVPVIELLDDLLGLGMPSGYPGSSLPRPARVEETWMADLARVRRDLTSRQSWIDGIPVTRIMTRDVERMKTRDGRLPASLDLFMLINNSEDPEGIVISPVGSTSPAGASFGRFAHLLDAVPSVLTDGSALELEADAGVVFCHIDYLNSRPHMNNVAFAPRVFDAVIPLTSTAYANDPARVDLRDILVGWNDGFYLRDSRSLRRVVVRNSNILNRQTQPGLVRFLLDVSDDGVAKPGWAWGDHEEHWDVLPRVQTPRGVVVAPAQWRIPHLPGDRDSAVTALRAWADAQGLPRYVYVGIYDNRLLLDLRDDLQAEILLREHRSGAAWVQEGPTDHDGAAVVGPDGSSHLAEVVLPLRRSVVSPRPPLPVRGLLAHGTGEIRARCAPGVEWWSLRLAGRRKDQDAVLRKLAAACRRESGEFFFVRYGDPDDHLRLRVRAGGKAAEAVLAEASEMLEHGMLSDVSVRTYEREVERYGGPQLLRECEALFCRSSAETVEAMSVLAGSLEERAGSNAEAPSDAPGRITVGAAVLYALLRGLRLASREESWLLDGMCAAYSKEFGGDAPGLRRAVQRGKPVEVPRLKAVIVEMSLLDSAKDASPGIAGLASTCRGLSSATEQASPTLAAKARALGDERCFSVLSSLVHMQANRIGFDRRTEYQALLRLRDALSSARRVTEPDSSFRSAAVEEQTAGAASGGGAL